MQLQLVGDLLVIARDLQELSDHAGLLSTGRRDGLGGESRLVFAAQSKCTPLLPRLTAAFTEPFALLAAAADGVVIGRPRGSTGEASKSISAWLRAEVAVAGHLGDLRDAVDVDVLPAARAGVAVGAAASAHGRTGSRRAVGELDVRVGRPCLSRAFWRASVPWRRRWRRSATATATAGS